MHNPMITFSVPSQKRGTSDGNAWKVSEVPEKRRGPPTVLQGKCRRCRAKRGTSDRFAGNLSEVLRLSGVQKVNVYEAVDFLDEFY